MPTPTWSYKPDARGYEIQTIGPETLTTDYEDNEVSVREKSGLEKRLFIGQFTVTPDTWRLMVLRFKLYRHIFPLTIITFDPEADDPDNDIAVVRFWPPRAVPKYVGPTMVQCVWRFREV